MIGRTLICRETLTTLVGRTAIALGLAVAQSLLLRANEVIE
jgi:hypothetical protein